MPPFSGNSRSVLFYFSFMPVSFVRFSYNAFILGNTEWEANGRLWDTLSVRHICLQNDKSCYKPSQRIRTSHMNSHNELEKSFYYFVRLGIAMTCDPVSSAFCCLVFIGILCFRH